MKIKVIKSFRKSLSLSVRWEIVTIRAPYFTRNCKINEFISKHKERIDNRLEVEKSRIIPIEKINEYKKKAKNYIPNRVIELADIFWFKFNIIKITSAKTRWGSCTSKKNLNFSYRLILCPKEVIDYVICHELSHLKHMNHSRNFWNEVSNMMPDYKEHDRWLKKNGLLF